MDELKKYSRFTQVTVNAWRRLSVTYSIGGTQVPWVLLWLIVTGCLMALGNLGVTMASAIFLGSVLAATFPHKVVVQ